MLQLRTVNSCLRRFCHVVAGNRDQVLERLQTCFAEGQVLDVVGNNKAKLTVEHVNCAVGMLWQFQREKPHELRTVDLIKTHPQFITLRVLAENKIALMDDFMLVDMLYAFLRLHVEPHDSLVQQLVSEAWRRIDRIPMTSLSKFAVCLVKQHLYHSPLMGRITGIVDQKLPLINDSRVLAPLMLSVSSLVSPRLRDALISRADDLLSSSDPSNYNVPRRMLQFMHNVRYIHRPLVEKCNKILLHNISRMDADSIAIILGLCQPLNMNNCDFKLAAKERMTELIDSTISPPSFTKLFMALAPMASHKIRKRLESTALLLADEFNAQQIVTVAEILEETQSRNLSLLNKIASVIQRNLYVYKPDELARIAQTFILLQYQNPEFFTELHNVMLNLLQRSAVPRDVTTLIRTLSTLPYPQLDQSVVSRVYAVVDQCNLSELNTISFAVAMWMQKDPLYRHNTHRKYVGLLQTLNRCGSERLQKANRLDLLLDELRYVSGEWFEEMMLEEVMVTLQRMMDQINWTHLPKLALLLIRMNYLCPPLMDRIASLITEHIEKIDYTSTHAILLPFSVLNYDSVQADELYDACIKHFSAHISSLDPHVLVMLAYWLAVVDRFPEELVRKIFNIDFLQKLGCQLEVLPDGLTIRQALMQLNRAVCLECPEFQLPWFHDRYCQQRQRKVNSAISPVQQQIHKILGEVLGGFKCVQVAAVTPYFYTVDFECKLDKYLKPLPYTEPSTVHISDRREVHWETSLQAGNELQTIRDDLPPGAQRVAINFLHSDSFCKNSHHMKGKAVMKKRHLEILGYRVVQVPHFEWNSLELSTHDAWKEYLKKKIFT